MAQSWSLPTRASASPTASPTRTSLPSLSALASSAQPTAAPASSSTSLHRSIPPSLASQVALFAQQDSAAPAPAATWSPANDEERATLAALLREQQEENYQHIAGSGERWEERRRAPVELYEQEARRGLRERRSLPLAKRQSAEGYPDCSNEGNGVLSCFPFSNTTLVDDVWSKFIWNARYPTFIGAGFVDIYLYHADSETIATSFLGIDNSRGMIGIRPDDEWWPTVSETSWEQGTNQTWPYFFVIVDANATITGGEEHQSTFVAVQTAAPSSLSSSILSASSASAASLASQSSASRASASSSSVSSASAASRTANTNALQDGSSSGGGGLPHWAIAVIVVLGFLALVAFAVGAYVCMVCARRRRERDADGASSGRGSEQPMMSGGNGGGAGAAEAAMMGGGVGAGAGAAAGSRARDSDGVSRGPTSDGGSDAGPITHTDAAIMAEAFRKALRKPEFPSGETTPSPGALAVGAQGQEGEVGEMGEMGSDEGEHELYQSGGNRESRILGDGGQGGQIWENEIRSEGRSLSSVQGGRRWGQQG